MSETTLFVYTARGQALRSVVRAFAAATPDNGTVALLYAPGWCRFAVLTPDGGLRGENNAELDLSPVFEARLFGPVAELRWLNDPGPEQRHRAAVLTDAALPGLGDVGGWEISTHPVVGTLAQTYLLWGEGTGRSPGGGWSEVATARVGGLPVPLAGVGQNRRVLLHAVEYLEERDHGNVVVLDERLVRLGVERG